MNLKGDRVMKTAFTTIALGAALLLTGPVGASAQEGLFTSERDCAVDVKSLCAGVAPGEGRILACLQAHEGGLSVGCSTILSKAAWTAKECAGDIQAILPQCDIQQHFRLHEAASRRGQRPVQGSAGVHGLSRRRSVLRASMRKSALIGATAVGAALLATLPIPVKWSAEKNLSVSVDGNVGWLSVRSQQPI